MSALDASAGAGSSASACGGMARGRLVLVVVVALAAGAFLILLLTDVRWQRGAAAGDAHAVGAHLRNSTCPPCYASPASPASPPPVRRAPVVPFSSFESYQQTKCASFARNASLWNQTVLIERNVFFVWIGPADIPDRATYAVAAAATVYGPEWTVYVVTNRDTDVLKRVDSLLAGTDCLRAQLRHWKVDPVAVTRALGWTEEQVRKAELVNSKDGRGNVVSMADIVRAAVVYWHGGLYLDMDAIAQHTIVRPLIGVDCAAEYECYPDRNGFTVEHGFFPRCSIACMSNGVFAFQRGHPLLARYLREMGVQLEPDHWGVVGPRLFFETLSKVRVESPHILDDVYAVDMKCLMCVRGGAFGDCTMYHYGSGGDTGGGLPDQARNAYNNAVDRYCTKRSEEPRLGFVN